MFLRLKDILIVSFSACAHPPTCLWRFGAKPTAVKRPATALQTLRRLQPEYTYTKIPPKTVIFDAAMIFPWRAAASPHEGPVPLGTPTGL